MARLTSPNVLKAFLMPYFFSVLRQLAELLGNEVLNPVSYFDKVWTDEFVPGENRLIQRPHQNNGHPLLQQSYMNGKLYFSGTETATEFPGYGRGRNFGHENGRQFLTSVINGRRRFT